MQSKLVQSVLDPFGLFESGDSEADNVDFFFDRIAGSPEVNLEDFLFEPLIISVLDDSEGVGESFDMDAEVVGARIDIRPGRDPPKFLALFFGAFGDLPHHFEAIEQRFADSFLLGDGGNGTWEDFFGVDEGLFFGEEGEARDEEDGIADHSLGFDRDVQAPLPCLEVRMEIVAEIANAIDEVPNELLFAATRLRDGDRSHRFEGELESIDGMAKDDAGAASEQRIAQRREVWCIVREIGGFPFEFRVIADQLEIDGAERGLFGLRVGWNDGENIGCEFSSLLGCEGKAR